MWSQPETSERQGHMAVVGEHLCDWAELAGVGCFTEFLKQESASGSGARECGVFLSVEAFWEVFHPKHGGTFHIVK